MKNLLIQLLIIFIGSFFLYSNEFPNTLELSENVKYTREDDRIFLPGINYTYGFDSKVSIHRENKVYREPKISNFFTSLRSIHMPAYIYTSKKKNYNHL